MAKNKETKPTGRAKPLAVSPNVTKNRKRRYGTGGKLYCKGGKLK